MADSLEMLAELRARLTDAHLYLICDAQLDDQRLEAALRGGVEIVQIRLADAGDDAQILATAERLRPLCDHHAALLMLDDRPDLVAAASADGVHLESGRFTPAAARELIGAERLLGLSAGSPQRIDAAQSEPVDYISVGPVFASATKPESAPTGNGLVTYASRNSRLPFFAVGGIEPHTAGSVAAAGAQRIAVSAAIATSSDPERAAAVLRAEITAPADFLERYRARTEAQNAAARARLEPLAPGERPWPLRLSAALAGLAAIVNLVAYAAGDKIGGSRPSVVEIVLFSAVMLVLAGGMWRRRSQAVLAFMAVLAILVVLFALFLVEASNLLGVLVPLAVIAGGGSLFWKLVRVLGRIQTPSRPGG